MFRAAGRDATRRDERKGTKLAVKRCVRSLPHPRVPTETGALFRIKEPPKSVLRYAAEARIITLKRKTKLTRILTIHLPVTRLSSLDFFIQSSLYQPTYVPPFVISSFLSHKLACKYSGYTKYWYATVFITVRIFMHLNFNLNLNGKYV